MGSPVNRKRFEKEDLLKRLITFIGDNGGRFPVKEDWEAGKIKPSLRTFHRVFESLNQAFDEAKKYNSIGDYENNLFEKEQELILRKHRRMKKKEKPVSNIGDDNVAAQKQMESTKSPITEISTSSTALSGMMRCHKCGEHKNDWEMTIECLTPYRHEDICESCSSKN